MWRSITALVVLAFTVLAQEQTISTEIPSPEIILYNNNNNQEQQYLSPINHGFVQTLLSSYFACHSCLNSDSNKDGDDGDTEAHCNNHALFSSNIIRLFVGDESGSLWRRIMSPFKKSWKLLRRINPLGRKSKSKTECDENEKPFSLDVECIGKPVDRIARKAVEFIKYDSNDGPIIVGGLIDDASSDDSDNEEDIIKKSPSITLHVRQSLIDVAKTLALDWLFYEQLLDKIFSYNFPDNWSLDLNEKGILYLSGLKIWRNSMPRHSHAKQTSEGLELRIEDFDLRFHTSYAAYWKQCVPRALRWACNVLPKSKLAGNTTMLAKGVYIRLLVEPRVADDGKHFNFVILKSKIGFRKLNLESGTGLMAFVINKIPKAKQLLKGFLGDVLDMSIKYVVEHLSYGSLRDRLVDFMGLIDYSLTHRTDLANHSRIVNQQISLKDGQHSFSGDFIIENSHKPGLLMNWKQFDEIFRTVGPADFKPKPLLKSSRDDFKALFECDVYDAKKKKGIRYRLKNALKRKICQFSSAFLWLWQRFKIRRNKLVD